MGNDHALETVGIGPIKVKIDNGVICTISKVWYMKGIKKNLLSNGELDDLGYEVHFKNGIIKLITGVHGRTYQEAETFIANSKEELIIMWHCKLGHI